MSEGAVLFVMLLVVFSMVFFYVMETHYSANRIAARYEMERELRELDRLLLIALLARQRQQKAEAPQPKPLPAWASVLQVTHPLTRSAVTDAYRRLSRQHHPDVGGSVEAMQRLNVARDQAEAWLAKQS
jgi:hypothetical protein